MSSMADVLRELGRCGACYLPLRESPHVNMVSLNKYKTWEYPGWGNILARDPDKRSFGRATAILCDRCIEEKNEPILAVEFYKEGGETRIRYRCVDLLEDAEPITEADLKAFPGGWREAGS